MTDNPVRTVENDLESEFPMPDLESFNTENQGTGPSNVLSHQQAINVLQAIARMQSEHDVLLGFIDQANRRLEMVFGDLQTMINNREEMLDKLHKKLNNPPDSVDIE